MRLSPRGIDCETCKDYIKCGECPDVPCKLFYEFTDPNIAEEIHAVSIKERVKFLKGTSKNCKNCRYGFLAHARNPCIPVLPAVAPPYHANFLELIEMPF
jgi:hypothetical protein